MEAIALLAMLAFAINKTVTVIKAIGKDTNTVVTQVLVWGVGIVGIWLAGQAQFTADLVVPEIGLALGDLNFPSVVMAAWMLGSTGSFLYDFKAALDTSDSAAEPRLLSSVADTRGTRK